MSHVSFFPVCVVLISMIPTAEDELGSFIEISSRTSSLVDILSLDV